MNPIRICAISDLHGYLPELNRADLVVICGDTVPLECQRSIELTEEWFANEFRDWVMRDVQGKVVVIGGNHDFWMFRKGKEYVKQKFGEWYMGKCVYIEDELYEFEGLYIYGCPWTEGPYNWAFAPGNKYRPIGAVSGFYADIPKCDILLTHQPPKVGDVGVSFWNTTHPEDWSSETLRFAVKNANPILHFFGHVHSGCHLGTPYPTYGCDTIFYNVSIKDESYQPTYNPLYLDFDVDTHTFKEKIINLD